MNKKNITTYEELPLTLTVSDVQRILGICRRNAYQLCNSESLPHKKIGSRIIVNKYAFIDWLKESS
jgi:hypothetical protein